MAWLWLWHATYFAVAAHEEKLPPWTGSPDTDGCPEPIGVSSEKLTHAVKGSLPSMRPASPVLILAPLRLPVMPTSASRQDQAGCPPS